MPPLVPLFNRLARILAGRRLYALLRHTGRRSGKRFETPVVAWKTRSGILVPIAWGTKADWYRNTVAAGGCDIRLRGRWYHCATPRVVARAEALAYLAEPMRTVVRLGPVRQFLLLTEARVIEDASLA
jgi:deazaflavin-dependent oxidoreductase (nitroreductase family)